MEENSNKDQISSDQPDNDSQADLPTPPMSVSDAPEPKPRRRLSPNFKKLPPWLVAVMLVTVFAGLLTCCYLGYKKINTLSQQNKELNTTVEGYKKDNAKPVKLTDAALQTVAAETKSEPAPAPAESGSYGGVAVQVNADDPSSASPKYIGGEYAPYWILSKFALTIPTGTKMVRTTDVATDGHLLTADNEGGAGCGGQGIYMTVSSTVTVPGGAFRAWGSSASYERGVGCGGADPLGVVSVRYYPLPKASQYKYVEMVTGECAAHDNDYNCVASSVDKTKWRVYSGIVLANAQEYKAGDTIDGGTMSRQLYNRDKYGAQFYVDCSNDKYGHFSCSAQDYKNGDFNAVLKDTNYTSLKNIILNIHQQ